MSLSPSYSLRSFPYSFSHSEQELLHVASFFDKCKEGETIFSDFQIIGNSIMMNVEYYTRINGKIQECYASLPYTRVLTYPWTYCAFPLPDSNNHYPACMPPLDPNEPIVPAYQCNPTMTQLAVIHLTFHQQFEALQQKQVKEMDELLENYRRQLEACHQE